MTKFRLVSLHRSVIQPLISSVLTQYTETQLRSGNWNK